MKVDKVKLLILRCLW